MAERLRVRRERDAIWIAGSVDGNRMHRHHALQVCWARDADSLSLQTGAGSCSGPCVVVESQVSHALRLHDGVIGLFEAQSVPAMWIRQHVLRGGQVALGPLFPWDGNLATVTRALDPWLEPEVDRRLDPRIEEVLGWLDRLEEDGRWRDVSLAGALDLCALSSRRFRQLFSAGVGTPWRTYLVWRRALYGMGLVAGGWSLTDAAYGAGYADSAHFSRQFVALFGLPPSVVAHHATFSQDRPFSDR